MYNVGLPHIMCVGLCPMQLSRAWRFRYLGWMDIYIHHISNVYDIHMYIYICVYLYIYTLYHYISSFKHGTWQLINFWRFHGTLFLFSPQGRFSHLGEIARRHRGPHQVQFAQGCFAHGQVHGGLGLLTGKPWWKDHGTCWENHGNFRQKDVMKNAKEINFNQIHLKQKKITQRLVL